MKHILCLISILLIISCDRNEDASRGFTDMDLTYIIYMAADNSLSSNVESNLNGIRSGISRMHSRPNVVALVDKSGEAPQLISFESGSDGSVTRTLVKVYDETNVLAPDFMSGVLGEIAALYPSNHYALDLWSHGMGWIPADKPFDPFKRWFGQDDTCFMDIKDLGRTLERAGLHYDFLMFDACLMSTVEVAYELRDVADCIIASPIEVWEMGFPYSSIMPALEAAEREVAIARAYAAYYDGTYNSSYGIEMTGAISVIDCSGLEELARVTRAQLEEVQPVYDETFVDELLRYDRNNYHYLYDFGDYMTRLLGADGVAPVKDALDGLFLYRYSTPTFGYGSGELDLDPSRYTGIGAYVPRKSYGGWNDYYKTLQWYRDTEFLPIY